MEDTNRSQVDKLFLHVREYVEARVRLVSLDLHDKASRGASGVAAGIIFLVFGIFILLFFSLAASWWIGRQTGEPFMGFLAVGGFYLVIGLLIYINRNSWIRKPVINAFLKNIADEED
jgi:hypothetical protein